jgi:hypothetical protein
VTRRGSRHPSQGKQGIAFAQLNRDKKSLAIDLKHPEGREVFLKLASSADVLLEQFRLGVCDRLGIGYSVVEGVRAGQSVFSMPALLVDWRWPFPGLSGQLHGSRLR